MKRAWWRRRRKRAQEQASADTTAFKTPQLGMRASSAIPVTLMTNVGQYQETATKADVALTQRLSSKVLLLAYRSEYSPLGHKLATLHLPPVSAELGQKMGLVWGRLGLLEKIELQKELVWLEMERLSVLVAGAYRS